MNCCEMETESTSKTRGGETECNAPSSDTGNKGLGLIGAGLLSAAAASACCWGPALLGIVGLGSLGTAAAAAVSTYRPSLMMVTLGLLAVGFLMVYRQPAATAGACAVQPCVPGRQRRQRRILWMLTAAVLGLLAYPTFAGWIVDAGTPSRTRGSATNEEVTLALSGMTCPGCAGHVHDILLKHPGVLEAAVSYEEARARVRVKPGTVTPADLATWIQSNTPYRASAAGGRK